MRKLIILILAFLLGGILMFVSIKLFSKPEVSEDSRVINYQLNKLNKMVVAEQAISQIFTHNSKKSLPGLSAIYSADKKLTFLVNAKVQASYDLSKMEVKLDSVNKKIVINSIPPIDIKVYSDVDFFDLNQSVFNKFEKNELNDIKNNAIKQLESKIDKENIKKEAHQQLLQNLSEIYLLANVYNWDVEDNTIYANELKKINLN